MSSTLTLVTPHCTEWVLAGSQTNFAEHTWLYLFQLLFLGRLILGYDTEDILGYDIKDCESNNLHVIKALRIK